MCYRLKIEREPGAVNFHRKSRCTIPTVAMHAHVKVTPARWWHVPAVSHLIRESRRQPVAIEGEALVWAPRWSPSLALLQSVWSAPVPGMPGPRSFVAEQGGRAVGLGQMRPRREPHHWEVMYLAVEPDGTVVHDGRPRLRLVPDRRATRLAGELCDAAVRYGAERLFVRIADDGDAYDVFRQVGFTPVARELTYFLAPGDAPHTQQAPARIAGLRPQHRADTFSVLQLYHETTPKVVQLAEGKRSQSWELASGLRPRLASRPHTMRWVVERDGRKVGWLQVARQRRRPYQVRLMVSPTADGLADQLIRYALSECPGYASLGVAVKVREHQSDVAGALEAGGFELLDSQQLMVKQLAARVLQPGFSPVLEKVV